jgi:hypothetical protein
MRRTPLSRKSAVPQLGPGHHPPTTSPGPSAFRGSASGRAVPAPPGPLRSAVSTRTRPPPAAAATVTVFPDRRRKADSPAGRWHPRPGCPGPGAAPAHARATRVRSARPAAATLFRTAAPAASAAALPQPPAPGDRPGHVRRKCTLSSASAGPCPWLVRRRGPCPWPSVENRRSRRPSWRHGPVRYMSVDTATRRPAALQDDTRRDKRKRPAGPRFRS